MRSTASDPEIEEPRSGYICIALPGERLNELDIGMMVSNNEETYRTAYTVTVDYKHGW
jgi:3,4-dihydroxy-2-butanone 4-phosphate synthase